VTQVRSAWGSILFRGHLVPFSHHFIYSSAQYEGDAFVLEVSSSGNALVHFGGLGSCAQEFGVQRYLIPLCCLVHFVNLYLIVDMASAWGGSSGELDFLKVEWGWVC